MDRISFYWKNASADAVGKDDGVSLKDLKALAPRIARITRNISDGRKKGEFRFRQLPYDPDMIDSINREVEHFRDRCDVLIVLGIGGSALGNIALQTALNPYTYNLQSDRTRTGPLLFVLDNVDPDVIKSVVDSVTPRLKKTILNVISKSGDTAETIAQFVLFRELLQKKLGKRYNENVLVITDREKGALRKITREEQYRSIDYPDGVGGRFSVLSPVGLFSAGMCGADIEAMMGGAADMDKRCKEMDLFANPAAMIAAIHYLLDQRGKKMSVMMPYSSSLYGLADWYRQLWAESLGKQDGLKQKNVFAGQTPVKALGATDQHSQVQLYREGPNDKIFTFLEVERFDQRPVIPDSLKHVPELQYLAGSTFQKLINSEKIGTEYALLQSRRPTTTVVFPRISADTMGQFFYLYETAVHYMGELLEIDTFNQPAVELGKQATFAVMGRSGSEALAADIASVAQKDRGFML
ncbi:MAG: glucose-6-phosphate isomerase [Tepidisphaeraceae bacterium]|jgi:glucose-6-phosphate isomerase